MRLTRESKGSQPLYTVHWHEYSTDNPRSRDFSTLASALFHVQCLYLTKILNSDRRVI